MDSSLWQDEAQLANLFLEEEANRSSSESSGNGFHFNSTRNLKKNLAATFDKELADISVLGHGDHFESRKSVQSSHPVIVQGQSLTRPPLAGGPEGAKRPKKSRTVSVFLRIRPITAKPSSRGLGDASRPNEKTTSTIEVLKPSNTSNDRQLFPTTIRTYPPTLSNARKVNINRNGRDTAAYAKEFHFDRVMGPETSQHTVYSTVAAPMIQDLMDARDRPSSSKIRRESALLFSYGITNAGKTHTVLGDINSTNQSNWGIIPRAISDVFKRNGAHPGADIQKSPFNLYISFFEIYNENVYDLMSSSKVRSRNVNEPPLALKVRECRGQIFIRGLAKHKVNSVEHGIALTQEAHNKRHTSSNNLNSDSSRSHFVCQMQLVSQVQAKATFPVQEQAARSSSEGDSMNGYTTDEEALARSRVAASTIWIVDLAGSERSKRTQVGMRRQKESTKINNSLMTLMRCLNAMKDNGKRGTGTSVMPFRDSKLTHIFMDHLSSKSAARTAMMVNVNPSVEDFDETQHVLAYSRKAKLIEMNMEEYGVKRKQLFGDEYDHNGRKKARQGENDSLPANPVSKKPKSTMLSNLVKKLSPKRTGKRTNPANDKGKDDSNTSEEIQKLKQSLHAAEERATRLENENIQLLDELDSKEEQIRAEVAMEMEERLRETRTKHNEKYEHLRSAMHHQATKTDISVSMNRAGNQLEELMDKVDECEKEMIRMTQDHRKEVLILNDRIETLREKHGIATKKHTEDALKISRLEQTLRKSNDEIIRLKGIQGNDGSARAVKHIRNENYDTIDTKVSKCKRTLRSRKPFGNSTNQSAGSRVFNVNID